MRKLFLSLIIFLFVSSLHAQKDSISYKHEIELLIGDPILADIFRNTDKVYFRATLTFSYMYRPLRCLWVGGNFVNYFGDKLEYKWKEFSLKKDLMASIANFHI